MALSSLRSGVFSAANGGTAYDQAVGSFGGVKPIASDLLSSDGLPWTGEDIRPWSPTGLPWTGEDIRPYTPTTPYSSTSSTTPSTGQPYTPPAVPPWTPPPAVPPYIAPPAPPAAPPPDPPPPTTPGEWGFTYDQEGGGFSVDPTTGSLKINPTTAIAGWVDEDEGSSFDQQDFLRDAYVRNAPEDVLGLSNQQISLGNNYFIEETEKEDEGELSYTYKLVNRPPEDTDTVTSSPSFTSPPVIPKPPVTSPPFIPKPPVTSPPSFTPSPVGPQPPPSWPPPLERGPPPPTKGDYTYDESRGGFSRGKFGNLTINPETSLYGWLDNDDGPYFDEQAFLADAYSSNISGGVQGRLGGGNFIQKTQNEDDDGSLSSTYRLRRNAPITPMLSPPVTLPPSYPFMPGPDKPVLFNLGGGVGSLGPSYLRR